MNICICPKHYILFLEEGESIGLIADILIFINLIVINGLLPCERPSSGLRYAAFWRIKDGILPSDWLSVI